MRKPPLRTNALLLMPRVLLNPVVRMTAREMSYALGESLSYACLLGERYIGTATRIVARTVLRNPVLLKKVRYITTPTRAAIPYVNLETQHMTQMIWTAFGQQTNLRVPMNVGENPSLLVK